MNYRIVLILLAFLFLICNAHAVPQVDQITPDAYQGEHVDLSNAVAFPDYTLAWCEKEEYECTPPDKVIAIEGNMHNYYLDPTKFPIGTYYRWDGAWHRGENALAFIIRAGTRPNVTTTITPLPVESNITYTYANRTSYNSTSIFLARGDSGVFTYENSNIYGNGHLWMFGGTEFVAGGNYMKLDLPLVQSNNTYTYTFTPEITNGMAIGKYKGYLQFDGRNGRQDCFYNPAYKTPFNATYPILDSPYKNVSFIDINGQNPENVKLAFERMTNDSRFSDDFLVPLTVEVREPEIIVYERYNDNDTLFIGGKTSFNTHASITAIVDPDHWVGEKDTLANTYKASVIGSINEWRQFSISLPLRWGEMSIGVHDLVINGKGFENDATATQIMILPISDVWVMPTPTPVREKIVLEEYGWHRVVPTANITTVPTTISTTIATPIPNTTTIIPTTISTTRPTPTPTRDPNIAVPLPIEVSVIAVISVLYLWRKK